MAAKKEYEVSGHAVVSFCFTATVKARTESEAENIAKALLDNGHDLGRLRPMDWMVDICEVDDVEEA